MPKLKKPLVVVTRKLPDGVETRMRVFNAIRDLTADAYGGWKQVVALQAGGGLLAQRVMMHRVFDIFNTRDEAVKAYQL